MPMKNPVHPGRIVRHDCLEYLGLTVTAAAAWLGVSRQALNNIVNERAGISAAMAIRLTKAFGSTAETWLAMQTAFDLAAARKREKHINVRRYPRRYASSSAPETNTPASASTSTACTTSCTIISRSPAPLTRSIPK